MGWLILLYIALGILVIWFAFGILLPYFVLVWYLRISKICKTKELLKISKEIKRKDREKTLKNAYNYIIKNYQGDPYQFNPFNVLNLRNFTIKRIMKRKKKFIWCYSHIKLLKGLLIATKQFSRREVRIRWKISKNLAIHQYAIVKIGKKKYKVDPFYKIFDKI